MNFFFFFFTTQRLCIVLIFVVYTVPVRVNTFYVLNVKINRNLLNLLVIIHD